MGRKGEEKKKTEKGSLRSEEKGVGVERNIVRSLTVLFVYSGDMKSGGKRTGGKACMNVYAACIFVDICFLSCISFFDLSPSFFYT